MRKHFLILMLLALLPLTIWAADAPTVGTFVGQTVMVNGKPGIVTYKVTGALITGTSGTKYYPVTITGLDADGLEQLGSNIALEIPVSFNEKYGDSKYNYAVTFIEDGLDGTTPQAFYGLTDIASLKFIPYYTKDANNNEVVAVPLTDFTYTVGTTGQAAGHAGMTFYGCTGMKTLEFTSNCREIAQYSFQNTAIENFVIPEMCATIEPYAFYNCQQLGTVTVEQGNTELHTLAGYVFGNSSLATLNLTNASQLWTIGSEDPNNPGVWFSPFMYPQSIVNDVLTEVTLPASVRVIGTSFAKCTGLTTIGGLEGTSLSAPANAVTGAPAGTHIINGAFEGCRSLVELNFPNCHIFGTPFVGCKSLATITFIDGYNHEIFKDGVFGKNLFGVIDPLDDYYVLNDQKALQTLIFKTSANAQGFYGTINPAAFQDLKGLATVTFQGKVRQGATIGLNAFNNCEKLATLTFNGFDGDSFYGGDINIASGAFANTGITALDFKGFQIAGSYDNKTSIRIAGNVYVGNHQLLTPGAFANCDKLESVKFGDFTIARPDSVIVEEGAFVNNDILASVEFGKTTFQNYEGGMVKIYNGSFTDNAALTSVSFDKIESKKVGTFYVGVPVMENNDQLAGLTFAANNKNLVFGDGEHLQTVTFEDAQGGVIVGGGAFASTGLTAVSFGNISAPNVYKSAGHGFIIGVSAFEGGDNADKTVEIASVKDSNNGNLSFNIFQDAFAAKMLNSVHIGQIAASNVTIGENAFANVNKEDLTLGTEVLLSTQNLQTVILDGIKAGRSLNTGDEAIVNIREAAFWGGKTAAQNKTVTIGKIENSNNAQLHVNIYENAFAAEKLQSVTFADMAAKHVEIQKNAFANMTTHNWAPVPAKQYLQTVTFGKVANTKLTIAEKAFWGGTEGDKAVTFGDIYDTVLGDAEVTIGQDAFVATSLKSVEIGDMAAKKIAIDACAFSNATYAQLTLGQVPAKQNLQTVSLGNISAGRAHATFTAATAAFAGGNVAAKTVTIGDITDNGNYTMTATFAPAVAYADELATVTIGNMTSAAVAIGKSAFSGKQLTTVTLGDMKANDLTIADGAFANINTTDALTETVSIGEMKTVKFQDDNVVLPIVPAITNRAFQGPQVAGSTLNVSIKEISGGITVPAETFVAPAKGTASYTILGDVADGASAAIATTAFVGSKENVQGVPVNNTTSVKIQGNYNDIMNVKNTFTNVKDLDIAVAADGTAKNVNVNLYLRTFGGAENVTVGNLVKNIYGNTDASLNIKEIKFLGSVAKENAIIEFTSPNVRMINFANVGTKDVKVAAKAIASGAFEAAADNAILVGENISVVYREAQTDEAKNIFNENAFSTAGDDTQAVTLYTTEWTKANIYESQAAALNWKVYRLALSASPVAPGEEINVTVGKRATDVYAYGKLYLPKGPAMKYWIDAEPVGEGANVVNNVQIYYGRIDKSRNGIYMYSLPTIDGRYWIDATDRDLALLVRTKGKDSGTKIVATPVNAAEDAMFVNDQTGDYVYFNNSDKLNQLRYTTQKVANQNLKNDEEFFDRDVYFLANPISNGFAFIKLDKDGPSTSNFLPAKSLYITGKLATVNGHVNVIFDTDEEQSETTGIETVNVENNNDAIYNLQGVRVNGTAKGLFIQNGKKYVVK